MAKLPESRQFRLPFRGAELVERNFSQAGQDLFVLSVLNGRPNGKFLDLGCNQPILANNTYLLETLFGWQGLSVDIVEAFFELFVFRKTSTLVADARKLDWTRVIEILGPGPIDYLSLDLEPPEATFECLNAIPFEAIEFAVVTFEHDSYRAGDSIRERSRNLFMKYGYRRVCSDVKVIDLEFEDWYINPRLVDIDRASKLASSGEDWLKIIYED